MIFQLLKNSVYYQYCCNAPSAECYCVCNPFYHRKTFQCFNIVIFEFNSITKIILKGFRASIRQYPFYLPTTFLGDDMTKFVVLIQAVLV